MTVGEVATAKGVSEAGVRYAINDPNNKSLIGIKCGGRLLVLASSVATYSPRNYPRIEEFIECVGVDRHQQRILDVLADLAADIVEEHPIAALILRSTYPGGNILVDDRAGYSLGIVEPEDLHIVKHAGPTPAEVIFPSDSGKAVERKARRWAMLLVEEGWATMRTASVGGRTS